MAPASFQANLFAAGSTRIGAHFDPRRSRLDADCWVDHARGFLCGADTLFSQLAAGLAWQRGRRWMYEREVNVPRLTCGVEVRDPSTPPVVGEIQEELSRRLATRLTGAFAALYRCGNDSVAWHSDRVDLSRSEHTAAILSLGGPRRFLLRPKGGGRSVPVVLESGDLLVLGGKIQHAWEHCVPKVAHAHPRIALIFFGDDREPPPTYAGPGSVTG